jgi:putative endonuclease
VPKQAFVYILANWNNRVLYTGVTTDLTKRIWQHKNSITSGFTARYNVKKLVHFEVFEDPYNAIVREKQVKSWKRVRKIELVESDNPKWKDLSSEI